MPSTSLSLSMLLLHFFVSGIIVVDDAAVTAAVIIVVVVAAAAALELLRTSSLSLALSRPLPPPWSLIADRSAVPLSFSEADSVVTYSLH